MNSNNLALIITYLGEFPTYFPFFLQSCQHNPDVDFIIYTDADTSAYTSAPNVRFVPLTLDDFNRRATEKFGFPVSITKAYKLCDIKPMYGFLYEEQLTTYSHWGYCDVDMIFGPLTSTFTAAQLDAYDVISSHPRYMSGAFSIYRNKPEITRLFMQSKDWKRVLKEDQNFYFDEASNVIHHLWEGAALTDYPSEVESISHVVHRNASRLSVLMAPIISERITKEIRWNNGELRDGSQPITLFHYLIYKGKLTFNVPAFRNVTNYTFTRHGFFTPMVSSWTRDWAASVARNLSEKFRRKARKAIQLLTA